MTSPSFLDKTVDERSAAIARRYGELKPLLHAAADALDQAVAEALRAFPHAVITAARIKSKFSTQRKCQAYRIEPQKLLEAMNDFVAARVVCQTQQEVVEILHALQQLKSNVRYKTLLSYAPQKSGYRAVHLWVAIEAGGIVVNGEIQVQTLLQHSWSELTHDDIYKDPNAPPLISDIFRSLSDELHVAQKTADRLRVAVNETRTAHETIVRPLTLQIDAVVTRRDVVRYRTLLYALARHLTKPWCQFLRLRLAQRSPAVDPRQTEKNLDAIAHRLSNPAELRALAFLARCETPDRGFGGQLPQMISRLREIAQHSGRMDSRLARAIEGEAWFWIGELERHRSRAAAARAAYERSRDLGRYPARALHRLSLVARMKRDEQTSFELLQQASRAASGLQLIDAEVRRDMAGHIVRECRAGRMSLTQLTAARRHIAVSIRRSRGTVDEGAYHAARMVLAEIEELDGNIRLALSIIEKAVDAFVRIPHPLWEARARAVRCRLLTLLKRTPREEDIRRLRRLSSTDEYQVTKYLAQALASRIAAPRRTAAAIRRDEAELKKLLADAFGGFGRP